MMSYVVLLINLFFLSILVFIGCISTYTDIKFFKIRNKYILFGLIASLILYFVSYISGIYNNYVILKVLINFIFSFVIALVFWELSIWSAGDAKLFSILTLLIPITLYYKYDEKTFLGLYNLINIFLLIMLKFFYEFYTRLDKKMISNIFKDIFSADSLINMFLVIFASSNLFLFFSTYVFNIGNYSIYIILMILLLRQNLLKNKISRKWFLIIGFTLSVFLYKEIFALSYLFRYSKTIFLFILFNMFFIEMPKYVFEYKKLFSKIKRGTIVGESIFRQNKKYIWESDLENGVNDNLEIVFKKTAKGITNSEIDDINKLISEKKIKNKEINVCEHTCFAPYIFAGSLFTFLLGTTIYSLIGSLIVYGYEYLIVLL